MSVYTYICMYTHTHTSISIGDPHILCIYIYVCMYVCMYIYIYTQICISNPPQPKPQQLPGPFAVLGTPGPRSPGATPAMTSAP